MNITYPAIITNEDKLFYIGFPDLETEFYGTYGETFEEAIQMGKEYLVLKLGDLEEENIDFPTPSTREELKKLLKDNQELVYLNINFDYEKSLINISYVKKTLTIPSYLDILAKNKNINFSQLLQEALKKRLLKNN